MIEAKHLRLGNIRKAFRDRDVGLSEHLGDERIPLTPVLAPQVEDEAREERPETIERDLGYINVVAKSAGHHARFSVLEGCLKSAMAAGEKRTRGPRTTRVANRRTISKP